MIKSRCKIGSTEEYREQQYSVVKLQDIQDVQGELSDG